MGKLATRWAHNPKITGSSPVAATNLIYCFLMKERALKDKVNNCSHYIDPSLSPDGFFILIMKYNTLIAVLYSWEQKCFHTETLHEYIESNKTANITQKNHQFRLIHVCDSFGEAEKFIKTCK